MAYGSTKLYIKFDEKENEETKEKLDDEIKGEFTKYKDLKKFIIKRYDPSSFTWRLEWSLHAALSFLFAAIFTIYMMDHIDTLPLLAPILSVILSSGTFGQITRGSQSIYRGSMYITLITTIIYCIPYLLSPQYWYITLIYYSFMSFVLLIIVHNDSGQRIISLICHTLFVLMSLSNYDRDLKHKIADIWITWLLIPISILIAIITLFIPWPIFSYQQLLYIEDETINLIQLWLGDIIQLCQCKNDMDAHIEYVKLKKYQSKSLNYKNKLYSSYPIAKHYELISLDNDLLNEQRIFRLHTLNHVLLDIYDSIKHWEYDSIYFEVLREIRNPLKEFGECLIECLSPNKISNKLSNEHKIQCKQTELLKQSEIIIKDKYDKYDLNEIYSFIWFLHTLSEECIEYLELRSKYESQKIDKTSCSNKCKLFCSPSIHKILNPFPFNSWTDCKQRLSPFIHWKSHIFIQSISICIALTISSIFFIYPPLHKQYEVGYWASFAVIVVSDTNIGTSFQKSILRLEGTFFGVVYGFIIAELKISYNISQYLAVSLLTIWVFLCGYYRGNSSKGYSGTVAATTAWIVAVGIDAKTVSSETFVTSRILFTFIGLIISLIILQIFSTITAKNLLHEQIIESLQTLKEMFNDIYKRYSKIIVNNNKQQKHNDNINNVELNEIALSSASSEYILIDQKHQHLSDKQYKSNLKVVQLLSIEKNLINAAMFEPILWRTQFNQDIYLELNMAQFWMLRRILHIDLCIRSLLSYIENHQDNDADIQPFISYYNQIYEKSHKNVNNFMDYFIVRLNAKTKKGTMNNYENDQHIILEMHKALHRQTAEFQNLIKNINPSISFTATLYLHSLQFAVQNLTKNLSDFAESKLAHS